MFHPLSIAVRSVPWRAKVKVRPRSIDLHLIFIFKSIFMFIFNCTCVSVWVQVLEEASVWKPCMELVLVGDRWQFWEENCVNS